VNYPFVVDCGFESIDAAPFDLSKFLNARTARAQRLNGFLFNGCSTAAIKA